MKARRTRESQRFAALLVVSLLGVALSRWAESLAA